MPCGEYFTSYEGRMGLLRWRIQRERQAEQERDPLEIGRASCRERV